MSSVLKDRWINKLNDKDGIGVRPKFPNVIKIDVCNTCNYSCIFCPSAKQENKIGYIDDTLIKRVLRECYEGGAREVNLAMRGEPLLNFRLAEYIKYAKDIGYTYVFTNSNGYLLTEERSKELLDAGLDSIKISLNSYVDNYELIHGVDAYDRVKENIYNFNRVRKSLDKRCNLFLSYVAVKQTVDDYIKVEGDFKGVVDEIVFMHANSHGGAMDEVEQYLFAGADEYAFKFPCSQLFNTINITAEGYMIICCQDFENVGVVADLNNESVLDAWNGDSFTKFRERYLNKNFGGTLCNNCLFNKNECIKPLMENVITYNISEAKVKSLNKRIEELVSKNECRM